MTVIQHLKEYLKYLARAQTSDKRILRDPHHLVPDMSDIQSRVACRAFQITALHNYYNKLRGVAYRHSLAKYDSSGYCRTVENEVSDFHPHIQEFLESYKKAS